VELEESADSATGPKVMNPLGSGVIAVRARLESGGGDRERPWDWVRRCVDQLDVHQQTMRAFRTAVNHLSDEV
jgi:hypothetical protein